MLRAVIESRAGGTGRAVLGERPQSELVRVAHGLEEVLQKVPNRLSGRLLRALSVNMAMYKRWKPLRDGKAVRGV